MSVLKCRNIAKRATRNLPEIPAINRLSVAPNRIILTSVKALLLALGLALTNLPLFGASGLPREPDAVYLEDLDIKPVKLTVIAEPAVYSLLTNGRYLGTLRKGTVAELVAVAEKAIRVRGTARQGGVVGWVDAAGLTPLKTDFVESLRQNAKRKASVDALIAKGEVALNMTHEEVISALGKPQKKSSKLDAKGRQEVWEFIRYARVPQETTGYDSLGRLVSTIVYVKVPAGKLTVSFENNLVTSLEQTEGTTDVPGPIRLVPAPVVVVY
jgi:hypothetical protein